MITKFASGPNERRLLFWCPGCNEPHSPRIEGAGAWTWNGDRDRPTLDPSILVTDASGNRCHSLVRDGAIQFLDDCSHGMKGRTVPLPTWPYDEGTFGGVEDG